MHSKACQAQVRCQDVWSDSSLGMAADKRQSYRVG
jgi:hypothetical protein